MSRMPLSLSVQSTWAHAPPINTLPHLQIHHCLRRILSRGSSRQESISEFMASSDGLGSLSILNEDSLRLILRDETLKDSLDHIASSSTQLLRQVLRSGMKLTLYLGDMKLAAKWGRMAAASQRPAPAAGSWLPCKICSCEPNSASPCPN